MALLSAFITLVDWASMLVKPWLVVIRPVAQGVKTRPQSKLRPLSESKDDGFTIKDILKARAASGTGALILYRLGDTSSFVTVSYRQLYAQAQHYSQIIAGIPAFKQGQPVLLHLEEHQDSIVWFWATVLANAVPVLSPPFSNVDDHRRRHIRGLSSLLESPICITRARLLHLFEDASDRDGASQPLLSLHTIEDLCGRVVVDTDMIQFPVDEDDGQLEVSTDSSAPLGQQHEEEAAVLMLTSGSTGMAKAVRITHKQAMAAVAGKAAVRALPADKPFLNWIGLDHVASLVEIHLQALWLGVDQVHVHAADVIAAPTAFLDLLSRHGDRKSVV